MRDLRLLLFILALGVQAPQPQPGHGPYANQPGVKCYRGETRDVNRNGVKKVVHCECEMICDDEGRQREDGRCQTYCDNAHNQCLCHVDEQACDQH